MVTNKQLLYILKLNWMHLLGFYLCVEAMMFYSAFEDITEQMNWKYYLMEVILWAPMLMFTYGLMFIAGFYLLILMLDALCFKAIKTSTRNIVLLEWFLITPIFIYWAIENHYWLWIGLVISFLVTQLIRSKRIDKRILSSSTI